MVTTKYIKWIRSTSNFVSDIDFDLDVGRYPVVHSDLLLNKALSLPVGSMSTTSQASSERPSISPRTYYSSSLTCSSGRASRPTELDASWRLDDLFDSDLEDYELSQSSEGQSSQIKVMVEVLKDANQSEKGSDPKFVLHADVKV